MPGDSVVDGGGEKGAASEELNALKSQMEGMKGELDNLKAAKADLERMRDDSDKQLLSPEYLEYLEASKSKGKGKEVSREEVNFEEMTPAQIAKHFTDAYKGDLDKAVTSIGKRMDSLDDGLGRAFASVDLALAGIKHTDLGEALELPDSKRSVEQKQLVGMIHKVATENPSWNTERCYRQAKSEIKSGVEEKEEVERVKEEKERKLLSEKPGASSSVLQGKSIGKEDAANLAWKNAFGNKTSVSSE